MDLLTEALAISTLLDESGLRWMFVGGVAVGIHGYIRATEDIDIVIDEEDLQKIDPILGKNGFIINEAPIKFDDGFTLHRRVKISGDEYFVVDLLVPPEEKKDMLSHRIEGTVAGSRVYVASKEDLIQMKRGANRLQDKVDISELEKGDG